MQTKRLHPTFGARQLTALLLSAAAWAGVHAPAHARPLAAPAPASAAPLAPVGETSGADAVTQLLVRKGVLGQAQASLDALQTPPAGHASGEPPDPSAKAPWSLGARVANAASDMVISAMNFLGVPYRRGGDSADKGFDCSGFTRYVFEHSLGLVLPRRSEEQARAPGLIKVQREALKPGDLVFFNTVRRTFSHVGIYIGDNKFIHAPRPGGEVRIEDMRVAYWSKRFNGARRAPAANATPAPIAGADERPANAPADTPEPDAATLNPPAPSSDTAANGLGAPAHYRPRF